MRAGLLTPGEELPTRDRPAVFVRGDSHAVGVSRRLGVPSVLVYRVRDPECVIKALEMREYT
jgi:hypothetical protein